MRKRQRLQGCVWTEARPGGQVARASRPPSGALAPNPSLRDTDFLGGNDKVWFAVVQGTAREWSMTGVWTTLHKVPEWGQEARRP